MMASTTCHGLKRLIPTGGPALIARARAHGRTNARGATLARASAHENDDAFAELLATWDADLARAAARRVLRAAVATMELSQTGYDGKDSVPCDADALACLVRLRAPALAPPTRALLRQLAAKRAWQTREASGAEIAVRTPMPVDGFAVRGAVVEPPVYGACRPVGADFARAGFGEAALDALFAGLFEHVAEHAAREGGLRRVDLSVHDLYHCHVFAVAREAPCDTRARTRVHSGEEPTHLGVLFHAREYPSGFPCDLGWCAEGSRVQYVPEEMERRNLLLLVRVAEDHDAFAGARAGVGLWALDLGDGTLLRSHCVLPGAAAQAALTLDEALLGERLGDVYFLDGDVYAV